MSKIKSALELALSRTEDVQVDKKTLQQEQMNRQGRELAGRFLKEKGAFDLKKAINAAPRNQQAALRAGALETIFANLVLPRTEADLETFPAIQKAVYLLLGEKKVSRVMEQYQQLLTQYLQDYKVVEEQLRTQWEPRLRQKEELMAQKTGFATPLTVEQDREFLQVLGEEITKLKNHYNQVLEQGKGEMRRLL